MNVGDKCFVGYGNGRYGALALVKITESFTQQGERHYNFKFVENYASRWASKIPRPGDTSFVNEKEVKKTFDKAKESFKKDMKMDTDRDIVEYIFEGPR